MGEQNWLRSLQVGIPRHNDLQVALGRAHEFCLQAAEGCLNGLELFPEIETHIQHHLIIAAPRSMKLSCHGPDFVEEAALDIHMNVFIGLGKNEDASLDFLFDQLKSPNDLRPICPRDDLLASEHPHMGNAAHDIVWGQSLIHSYGRSKGLYGTCRRLVKTPRPQLFLFRHY